MITWGLISGAMALVQGSTSFYVLRFLLGAAEAGFFPGIILYLSYWFPARQRAAVTAIFMAAAPLSTVLGSPVSGALLDMHGILGLSGWQWMFIVEGVPAVILGIVVLFYMTDRPEKATWLSNDERNWLVRTMNAEAAQKAGTASHSVWRGLADLRVIALSLVYFGTSAGLYTLGIWAPQIIKQFGLSSLQVGFLNALPGIVAVVAMVLWARHSDRTGERTWHVVGACMLGSLGLMLAGFAGTVLGVLLSLTLVNIGISSAKPPLWSMPTHVLVRVCGRRGNRDDQFDRQSRRLRRPGDDRLDQGSHRQFPGRIAVRRGIAGSVRRPHAYPRAIATCFGGPSRRCASPTIIPQTRFSWSTQMREYSIAAIPADGIGPEVIAAGTTVLESLQKRMGDVKFNVETFDWGSDYYRKHGVMMPADGLAKLKKFDAIYFGAVGAPDVPDHITLWGLRLPICQGFDQYANVRPTKILPGITSPLRNVGIGDLDWVIVRENSEGEYAGCGGRVHRGLPEEVGTEVAIFTRVGVQRIMRFAFKLAQSRPRKLLTVVTKSNAQRHGMVMWDEIAEEVSKEFPDVTWDKMLVDAMTVRMTLKPQSLDTIVATNLHADILSDLAGALAGSLGVAPTGQYRSRAPFPVDVRTDPRLGIRHHRQRHRQSCRKLLDRRADARSSRRKRCLGAA